MLSFYAASFLSRPVIHKNGDLAGVCKEVAFSSRLHKMTGLIVYDREGKRRFLAARHIASQGYDAVILKTGAVLTEPAGSFPLGRLAYRFDGKPLSRIEDAALDEKRNVLFFTLASGESCPASAVIKNADSAVVFGQINAQPSPKRQYVRKKSKQPTEFSTALTEEKEAPSGEANGRISPNRETSETNTTQRNAAPNDGTATATSVTAIASAKPEPLPIANHAAKISPPTATVPKTSSTANHAAKISPPIAVAPQAQKIADTAAKAQISVDVAPKTAFSRPTAPTLYTLPGAGFTLPERVADGRNLLGRMMKSDLFTRGGTIILRAGECVTPAAVKAAARAGLIVDLVRKSRPVLF